LTDLAMN